MNPYWESVPVDEWCKIVLVETMEAVKELYVFWNSSKQAWGDGRNRCER